MSKFIIYKHIFYNQHYFLKVSRNILYNCKIVLMKEKYKIKLYSLSNVRRRKLKVENVETKKR